MNINLRKAKVKDISTLISIEKEVSGSKIYSPLLTEAEWLEELEKGATYFIELDGSVVGEVSCEMKEPFHVYIGGLVVKPLFQGKGIARKAMEILLAQLKDVRTIDLVTHPENEKAIKLYESLGFNIESRIENYFGDGEPRVRMVFER